MSPDPKTIEQIEREIAYYAQQIRATTSADRIQRAHKAIQVRERQLTDARRAEASRVGSGQGADGPDNALQRVGGAKRR